MAARLARGRQRGPPRAAARAPGPQPSRSPPRARSGASWEIRPQGAPAADGSLVDAAPWRAFWARARGELGGHHKLRFGRPYTPAATLDELEAAAPAAARADAALELAIVTRGASLLETDDWVARQRAVLSAARAALG